MADTSSTVADPFEPRPGRVASLAARLGCNEGQLYSLVIGVLLLWVVSANGLPSVVWDPVGDAGPTFQAAPSGSGSPRPAAGATPHAGLIETAPAPTFSPVTQPSPVFEPSPSVGDGGGQPPVTFADPPEEPGPLRIVRGGYASAAAGSPLATVGVPDGSVAVARRAGQPYHVTYLQLEGEGPVLELVVDGEGTTTFDALAELVLCTVPSSGWEVGPGDVSIEDAPDYDCSAAVTGERSAAGDRWQFDTSSIDTSAIGGVAIVPSATPGAPEFQIVFSLD